MMFSLVNFSLHRFFMFFAALGKWLGRAGMQFAKRFLPKYRRNTDCRHVLMIQIFFRLPYYRQLEKYRAYTPAAFSSSSAAKIPSAFPASGLSPVSRRRSLWTLPSMLVLLFFTTMPSSSKRLAKSHGSLPGM